MLLHPLASFSYFNITQVPENQAELIALPQRPAAADAGGGGGGDGERDPKGMYASAT
jgi:hypothetical protein